MGAFSRTAVTARNHPGGYVLFFVNGLFTVTGSMALTFGLRAAAEALDFASPEVLLFGLLIVGWIGGLMALSAWHARLWERGRRRPVVGMLLAEAACIPLFVTAVIALNAAAPTKAALDPYAADYMALTPADIPESDERLRGHCVIVEDRNGTPIIDIFLMEALPRPIRAREPAEVASVVQLRWGRRTLPNPEGAWVETCGLTILDADTRQVLARRNFTGSWREVRDKLKGKYWTGFLPREDVTTYLKGLRRVS